MSRLMRTSMARTLRAKYPASAPWPRVRRDLGVVPGGVRAAVAEPGLELEQGHRLLGVVELAGDRGACPVAGDAAPGIGSGDAGLAAQRRDDRRVDGRHVLGAGRATGRQAAHGRCRCQSCSPRSTSVSCRASTGYRTTCCAAAPMCAASWRSACRTGPRSRWRSAAWSKGWTTPSYVGGVLWLGLTHRGSEDDPDE